MTVVGPIVIGDIGWKLAGKQDYDTVTIEYDANGAIAVTSSDTFYSSGDAGSS